MRFLQLRNPFFFLPVQEPNAVEPPQDPTPAVTEASVLATPPLTRVELAEVVRESVDSALTQARRQEVERLVERAMNNSSSPLPGAPGADLVSSPYPIYKFDRPYVYSVPVPPERRPGSQVSIATLRQIADNYDILRACINHIKREVSAVPVQFVAKEGTDPKKRAVKRQIATAQDYFSKQGGLGGKGTRRSHFDSMVIEDLCVIGNATLFLWPNQGGGTYEVIPIDAATIRPRVDAFGWAGPGQNLYEQWIYGIMVAYFDKDQIIYDGIYPRSNSPFFNSPVEWLVNVVNSALRADDWNRKWLTDGNVPDALIEVPKEWTPDEIKDFAMYFDAMMAGDSAQRQKMKFVPQQTGRFQVRGRKDQDFQEFELWLARRTSAIMGVQLASVGFPGDQYKVSQEDSMQSTSWFGVGVVLNWRKEQYDEVLEKIDCPDIETVNVTDKEEDAKDRAERNLMLVGVPVKTQNEARQDEGLPPTEGGDQILVPNNFVPLALALNPPAPASPSGTAGAAADPNDPSMTPDPKSKDGVKLTLVKEKGAAKADAQKSARVARDHAVNLWEQKALRRLKSSGKPSAVPFLDVSIHPAEGDLVRELLSRADTPAKVLAAVATLQKGIYVARHAQTDSGDSGKVRGWEDEPLSKQGKKDAEIVGKWFQGRAVGEIRTSDLQRTVASAKAIQKEIGAPIVETNVAYREWASGDLVDSSKQDRSAIMNDYAENRPWEQIPAGESFNAFKNRIIPAIQDRMDAVEEGQGSAVTLIVSHSRVIRLLAACAQYQMDARKAFAAEMAQRESDGVNPDYDYLEDEDDYPSFDFSPYAVDMPTYLRTTVLDSAVLWLALTPEGWTWKILDPLPARPAKRVEDTGIARVRMDATARKAEIGAKWRKRRAANEAAIQ